MITSHKCDWLEKNTIIIKGRDDWKYRGYSMKIKDAPGVMSILPEVLRLLMLNDVFDVLFPGYKEKMYDAEEQYIALCEIIALSTENTEAVKGFDLQMAKVAVVNYIDMLRRDVRMEKVIQCGTKVIDREGVEFTAYSYKLTDHWRAMDLLSKVDFTSTAANYDPVSYNAMIEIIYLALNEKVDIEVIEKSMDAEFARKVLAVYYDVTGLFE